MAHTSGATRRRGRVETAALIAAITGAAGQAVAGPEGAQVARGSAQITRRGDLTTIRAADRAIINYRSFDIGARETVRFIQPSARARVLNRINSPRPTRIDGSLIANGHVYLVNPHGVVFTRNAMIDVGGLHAAAARMTDRDFLRGVDRFIDGRGTVVNEGTIRARETVRLIGQRVFNSGTIDAPAGTVVMASGDEVFVGPAGGSVFVRITDAGLTGPPAPSEADAAASRVASGLGAGDVYALAIAHTGSVRARDIRLESGQPTGVVAVSGTLDASDRAPGAVGGRVEVLGERVALKGATIDASGEAGGGTVLVGGAFQGRGPQRNAERTAVDAATTLSADATGRGDGGQVIVWADGHTGFAGHASVRGGARGGDGGFVEVSGKQTLAFNGTVDALAPGGGRVGDLLLDPTNIEVVDPADADTTDLADVDDFGDADQDAGNNRTRIADTAIEGAAVNVTLRAENDITFSVPVVMANNGVGITAEAGNDINVDAPITTRGGHIILSANDADASLPSGSGRIVVDADLSTNGNNQTGGNIELRIGGGTGTVRATGTLTTDGGDVQVQGSLLLTGPLTINTEVGDDGAAGSVTFDSAISALAPGRNLLIRTETDAAASAAGDVTLGPVNDSGGVALQLLDIDTTGPNAANTGVATLNGDVLLGTGGAAVFNSEVDVAAAAAIEAEEIDFGGGAGSVSGTGPLTLRPRTGGNAVRVGDAADTGAAVLDLTAADVAALGNVASGITIGHASSPLTVAADVAFDSPITLRGTTHTLTGNIVTSGDAIRLEGDAELDLAAPGTIRLDTTSGVPAGANVTITGATDAAHAGTEALEIDAGTGGDVALGAVGGTRALTTLTVTGDQITLAGARTEGAQHFTGDLTLTDDLLTAGGPVQIDGDLTLQLPANGTIAIDTTDGGAPGANITVTGATEATVTGREGLALTAGTGTVELQGDAGVAIDLRTFSASGAEVRLRSVHTGREQTITAPVVRLAGDLRSAISGLGPITVDGDLVVDGAAVAIDTTGASDVEITGDINGNDDGETALTLDAGTGHLTLSGGVGLAANARPLSLDATGSLIFVGDVRTTGSQAFHGLTTLRGDLTTAGGDVLIDGGLTLDLPAPGNIVIDTTDGGGTPAGGGITITGQTTAAGFDEEGLDLRAGTAGDIDLQDAAGTPEALRELIATGDAISVRTVRTRRGQTYTAAGALTIAGDLLTFADGLGPVSIAGNVLVDGASVAIDTLPPGGVSGSPIVIGGTVNGVDNGETALTLDAGPSTVTVNGAMGTAANRALASLAATGSAIDVRAIRTVGDQTFTGATTLRGNLTTTGGGDVLFNSPVTLAAANLTVQTDGSTDGDITAASTINGATALTLNAGTGLVTLSAGAGDATPLASLAITGQTTLRDDVTTAGGLISIDGDLTIDLAAVGDLTLDTTSGDPAGANITITGTTNAAHVDRESLVLLAGTGGAISLQGSAGNVRALRSFTATGAQISVDDVATLRQQVYNGPTTIAGNLSTAVAGQGSIAVNGAATVAGGSVSITTAGGAADDITFASTINGAANGDTDLSLDAGGGDISVAGAIGLAANRALRSLDAAASTIAIGAVRTTLDQAYTGTTTLGGNLTTTAGGDVLLDGPVTLGVPSLTVLTDGSADGDITATGTLNGASALTLDAGTGQIALGGHVGLATALTSLDATGSAISLRQVRTTGAQTYTGDATLAGNLTSTGAGDIAITGDTTLAAASVLVQTAGGAGDDIVLAGAVDGASALTLSAGAGDVGIGGDAGHSTALASLDATGAAIDVRAVRTSGDQTYNGATTLRGNLTTLAGGDVLVNGATTLAGSTLAIVTDRAAGADGDVRFASTLNGASALAIDAGSGAVRLDGAAGAAGALISFEATGGTIEVASVRTTGSQTYTGPTTLNGNLTTLAGGSVLVDGAATLAAPTIAVRTDRAAGADGDITFGGTLNGAADLTLDAGSGRVALEGNAGGTTALASLTAEGATIGLRAVRTTGAQSYTGDTTLAGNLTSTASGSITLDGDAALAAAAVTVRTAGTPGADIAVTGDVTGASNLTLDASGDGDVTIAGTVGTAATPLSSLTLRGASLSVRDVTTAGSQTYDGAVRLQGDYRITGPGAFTAGPATLAGATVTVQSAGAGADDDITFTAAVDSLVDGATALVLDAGSGDVRLDGDAGQTGRLRLFTATADSIRLAGLRTQGAQTFNGAATLSGDLDAASGAIGFNGAVTLAGPPVAITTAGANGRVTFGSTLDGGADLEIDAPGAPVVFAGSVGATTPLASLDVAASAIDLRAVTTSGAQTYAGPIDLRGNLRSTTSGAIALGGAVTLHDDITVRSSGATAADGVTFAGTVDSDPDEARGLTVITGGAGVVAFDGAVGAQRKLDALLVTANPAADDLAAGGAAQNVGRVRLGGDVRTINDLTLGGPVVLTGNATVASDVASVFFRGSIDGDGTPAGLTVLTDTTGLDNAAPRIKFGGPIGADQPLAFLRLNFVQGALDGRADEVPLVSTIVLSDEFDAAGRLPATADADGAFVVRTTGDFTMGRGEKLVAFGDLDIQAGGTARLGDLTSLGDIRVSAADIVLLARRQASLLENDQEQPTDLGLDYVAADTIDFNRVPRVEGDGPPPIFATSSGFANVDDELSGFVHRAISTGVSTDLFVVGDELAFLDLSSLGPSTTNVSVAIAGAAPTTETGSVTQPQRVSSNLRQALQEIGVYVKDLTRAEIQAALVGAGLFNDTPGAEGAEGPRWGMSNPVVGPHYQVTSQRVPARFAAEVIERARALVYGPVLDENGQPVIDPQTGEPMREDRRGHIRETLGLAWRAYVEASGPDADPRAFPAYLGAAPAHAEALQYLGQIAEILRGLRELGLSDAEIVTARAVLLPPMTPEEHGMTPNQLVIAAEAAAPGHGG